jgi:hypothetical protein
MVGADLLANVVGPLPPFPQHVRVTAARSDQGRLELEHSG